MEVWDINDKGGAIIKHELYEIKPGKKRLKTLLAKIILWFLGRSFQACALNDSRIRKELMNWNEGFTLMLKVEPHGPSMAVGKRSGKLKYIGSLETDDADIVIYFKNIEASLLVLTGRMGSDRAYAEHRFTLKGDIASGMSVVRCIYIIESYLFPKFMTRKILKSMPEKEASSIKIYLSALFNVI